MPENEKMSEKMFKYPPVTPEQRLIWEILFLLPVIITVAILGRLASTDPFYTAIIAVIFGINLSIRFVTVNQKGDWLFFILGVFAGGGNDLISMINGIYHYTSQTYIPFLNGLMPLWMILFWGQVFLLFRKIFHLPWCKGEEFPKDGRFLRGWLNWQLIFDLIILICLRIVIYNTYAYMWLPAIIYGIIIFSRFLVFKPKKNEIFIMAILPYAFLFEGLMVSFGLYVYLHPLFLGLPLWLFLWWLFLVPLILKEVFDRFEYYLKNKS